MKASHNKIIQGDSKYISFETYTPHSARSSGLSNLQKNTVHTISNNQQWGFNNINLKIKRHKLDEHNWQLTVVNPKTHKTILQAEGHGDTLFENEDNLAKMAQILMKQGLTIKTQFND